MPLFSSSSTLSPHHHLSAAALRRRSVDTGGLSLVVNDHSGSGSGRGYGGWLEHDESLPGSINVAELVVAMREETLNTIDQAHPQINVTRPLSEPQRLKNKYISELCSWKFDSSHLPLEEVLLCTMLLFELLWCIEGMEEDIKMTFDEIRPFLTRVSKLYREGSSYHNFQHALDVLQATYFYLYTEGCIPCITYLRVCELDQNIIDVDIVDLNRPSCEPTPSSLKPPLWSKPKTDSPSILQEVLRNSDIFALFIAAIGHDIGHPGLSNAFMRNAKTPLAELFDVSVLEKMHSTLLLQTMRTHGMAHLLDRPHAHRPSPLAAMQPRNRTDSDPGVSTPGINGSLSESTNGREAISVPAPTLKKWPSVHFKPGYLGSAGAATEFKALLGQTILFTDMSLHRDWMLEWHNLTQRLGEQGISAIRGANGKVDPVVRVLLCQALIKCADISNPSRPFPACKHWSLSLIHEWAEQALLEKQLALPISVTTSDDSKDVAEVQIGFINMFALPLLETASSVITAMSIFADQCRSNLKMWKEHLNGVPLPDAQANPSSTFSTQESILRLPKNIPDISTMFSLSLPIGLHSVSSESASSSGHESISSIRHDGNEMGTTTRTNGSTYSEPSSPVIETDLSAVRHSSYTELPQVTIPTDSMAFSGSQHIRSNSTASTSPLVSPRSLVASSFRSDMSSPAPSVHAPGSTVSVHAREALRAAYDAHERPKAKRWENRSSWQGIPMTFSSVPNATLVNGASTRPHDGP